MDGNTSAIGVRLFTDGIERPVFRDSAGRQYVIDNDGNRVHGIWILDEEAETDTPLTVPHSPVPMPS